MSGDRLYRRTDPPLPTDKAKSKYTSKKAQSQRRRARASKRRKVNTAADEDDSDPAEVDETLNETALDDTTIVAHEKDIGPETINTYGDYKWECVAVTFTEYNEFTTALGKTKDQNEINLKSFVQTEVLAALQAQEEKRQRKLEAQLREIQMAEKMQGAKRSGRLAAKQEREKEEAEAAEIERKRQTTLAEARKEQERADKMDYERQSRMMTREQRIKEREMKRVLMEDQLARDAEEAQRIEEGGARNSRHLKERIEKHKQELEEFEDDEWTFDCSGCHQFGRNFDDGEHSIACERCNVWQHSKCLGFTKLAAESEDFHFVCKDCRRKEEEAKRPRISLKFKVGLSSSPPQGKPELETSSAREQMSPVPTIQRLVSVDVPPLNSLHRPSAPHSGFVANSQSQLPAPPRQADLNSSQTSIFSHAMDQSQRPQLEPKLVSQHYSSLPQYAPHERLPGGDHARNLYQQITHQNNITAHPAQPQSNSSPSLPAYPPKRPASSHAQTPRAYPVHPQINGHSSPVRQRIASPIINRPNMSPTQGNPDVGPIAGVPGSSPIMRTTSPAIPYTNGNHFNGQSSTQTPAQSMARDLSFSEQHHSAKPMSGLSPTKQRTSLSPVPQASVIPQKNTAYTTPSSSFNQRHVIRSVSGTPIFPPAENLAPSPQQLNRDPVPTPSKHTPPPPALSLSQMQSFSSNVSHVSATPVPSQAEQNHNAEESHLTSSLPQQTNTVQ